MDRRKTESEKLYTIETGLRHCGTGITNTCTTIQHTFICDKEKKPCHPFPKCMSYETRNHIDSRNKRIKKKQYHELIDLHKMCFLQVDRFLYGKSIIHIFLFIQQKKQCPEGHSKYFHHPIIYYLQLYKFLLSFSLEMGISWHNFSLVKLLEYWICVFVCVYFLYTKISIHIWIQSYILDRIHWIPTQKKKLNAWELNQNILLFWKQN